MIMIIKFTYVYIRKLEYFYMEGTLGNFSFNGFSVWGDGMFTSVFGGIYFFVKDSSVFGLLEGRSGGTGMSINFEEVDCNFKNVPISII